MLALEARSDATLFAGELDASVDAGHRLFDLAAALDDPYFHVTARVNEALALAYGGDVDGGLAWVDGTDTRFPSADGWLAYGRGEAILDRDVPSALAELDQAVRVAVDVGNRFLSGVALVSASSLRARAADPAEAVSAFVDLLDHYADTGDRSQQLTTLKNLVVLLSRIDQPAAAIELAAVVLDDPTSPTYGHEAERLADALAGAEAALGTSDARRARAAAAGRSIDDAATVAREVLTDR